MENEYEVISQTPTTIINQAGNPEAMIQIMFSFDGNRTGVIYIKPQELGSIDVKARIMEYIENSRQF